MAAARGWWRRAWPATATWRRRLVAIPYPRRGEERTITQHPSFGNPIARRVPFAPACLPGPSVSAAYLHGIGPSSALQKCIAGYRQPVAAGSVAVAWHLPPGRTGAISCASSPCSLPPHAEFPPPRITGLLCAIGPPYSPPDE
jgi:hypothetical protein